MNTLYIAEKPDIATAIAAYLWPSDYKRLKGKNAFCKGDVSVTWAFGHILMTAMPEAYGEQYKDFSKYPIFPKEWKKIPSPSCKEQYEAIKKMLKDTDVVVHAGDPDREGQLLVDEILVKAGYKGVVKRILINAKDDASMKRAFDGICPNERYHNLYLAGLAREQSDWLYGMNLSRAYTICAKRCGLGGVWRIGRVKIPTLALVVAREREIQNFKPVDYFTLTGKYIKDGLTFSASLVSDDNAPVDSEGRILDKSYLQNILTSIDGKNCKVTEAERKSGSEGAPLPYSLDTIQADASRRYNISPADTLKIIQSLYEKKFVSYPRSDCNYIPTSQHSDAERILRSLTDCGMTASKDASPQIKSKAFNDSKVSAHHAIIPTGVIPSGVTDIEKKVYDMIAMRYIIQFFPPCKFETLRYKIDCNGHSFTGTGRMITSLGWKGVNKGDDEDDSSSSSLPNINVGDILMPPTYNIETKQTQPPKRFTEGTIISAMSQIWRFVAPDCPDKECLKNCKGIGTPATRASILSELMAEATGKNGMPTLVACIRKEGKELVPTAFGCSLIDNVDKTLTMPEFTAKMEYNLSEIAEGRMSLEQFVADTEKLVLTNIDFAEKRQYNFSKEAKTEVGHNTKGTDTIPAVECPVCHQKTLERKYSPKTKNYFWVCSDKSCVHPVTKKTIFFNEERKKPLIRLCPDCNTVLSRVFSKKTEKYYWLCPKCDKFINDNNNNKKKDKK